MKRGDLVTLVDSEARQRFGSEPFEVTDVDNVSGAVVLDGLGSVDMRDVTPVPDESPSEAPTVQQPVEQRAEAPGSHPQNMRLRRIESIAAQLVSHPDPNVVMSGREILRILWGDDDETESHVAYDARSA